MLTPVGDRRCRLLWGIIDWHRCRLRVSGDRSLMDRDQTSPWAWKIRYVTKLRRPRLNNRVRQALQVLVTAQSATTKDRTRYVNALIALVRRHALGVDALKALRGAQISNIARWRARKKELAVAVARAEAHRLAKYIVTLDDQLRDNDQPLTDLVTISEAAPLLQRPRFGDGQ